MEKKICQREKCKKEFAPNKPRQRFCSDKCRVYHSRETKIILLTPPEEKSVILPISAPEFDKAGEKISEKMNKELYDILSGAATKKAQDLSPFLKARQQKKNGQ